MIDTAEMRRARVLRVVAVGRRVADPGDLLGQEARRGLVASSGLSPEGVALALAEHLETDPAPEHLDALLGSAGAAPRCHVVLAANVCTAALRAVAVAVATAPIVAIRPSRRDPVLAALLVRELGADAAFATAGGAIARVAEVAPAAGDELHVHGSDETVEGLRATLAPGVVLRGHGTGLGVAVVGAGAAIEEAARRIAGDVVPFDQRGCLSPRAVLVEGGTARAARLADSLDRALGELGERVPRGPQGAATLGEIALYRAAIEAVGTLHAGPHHVVGIDLDPRALPLPPAARVVHVAACDAGGAPALLAPWARWLTTIGSDDEGPLARAVLALAPRARRARLGAMQRPPLDGPVDLRRR